LTKVHEVDNECTLHNSVILAICMPKIIKFSGDLMVPYDRTLATSHRLSMVTMSPSAAVWPQFSINEVSSYKWLCLGNGKR